jgi:hypothetical protein
MSSGHNRGSRARLTEHNLPLFQQQTLFGAIARTVCGAGCLPRKELYEAWEVARRVRRRFRGGRVVELASGHGLLAYLMLVLDDSSPEAWAVDMRQPKSAATLAQVIEARWPRLAGRVHRREADLETIELRSDDVVLSAHACGPLTDRVIALAVAARARVAVLPCCHSLAKCDTGGLEGWVDGPLAIDMTRAGRLRAAGYKVHTQMISPDISPKNRLLLGDPRQKGPEA